MKLRNQFGNIQRTAVLRTRRAAPGCRPCHAIPLILLLVLCNQSPAQTATAAQIKAAYLINFANFVSWPSDALGPKGAPFVICVAGSEPVADALDFASKGRRIDGSPIVIRRVVRKPDLQACRILYLHGDKQGKSLLPAVTGAPTLTVGEAPNFIGQGGMIEFTLQGQRVRFDVNLAATAVANLAISSKLLAVARVVKGGK